MERRGFIRRCAGGLIWLLGGGFVTWPVHSFIGFRKTLTKRVVFGAEDLAMPVPYKEGVYLVKGPGDPYALSGRCTHLGCSLNVDPVSGRWVCPCHGSVFDRSGKRISGPAQKDLPTYPLITKANGDLEAVVDIL